jgi:hypothetical protein
MMSSRLAFAEQYYTVVRLEESVLLIPRSEIEVELEPCNYGDDVVAFRITFAPGVSVYLEASPVADFESALRNDNFELLNSENNFDAKLARRGDYVDLKIEGDRAHRHAVWHIGECTVELTADAWAILRSKMLELLEDD